MGRVLTKGSFIDIISIVENRASDRITGGGFFH